MPGSTAQTNKFHTFYLQQRQDNGDTWADIKVNHPLDYETIKEYNLTIRVEVSWMRLSSPLNVSNVWCVSECLRISTLLHHIKMILVHNWIMKMPCSIHRAAFPSILPLSMGSNKLPRQDLNDKGYYHALVKIRKLVFGCWVLLTAGANSGRGNKKKRRENLSRLPFSTIKISPTSCFPFNYLNYILCKITLWYLISIKRRVDKREVEADGAGEKGWGNSKGEMLKNLNLIP